MTADNQFVLYVNGKKVGSGNSWTKTYTFNPKVSKVRLIAIDAVDRGGPAAIIGTFGHKPSKASQWRCKEFNRRNPPRNWNQIGFNDRRWPVAKSYGRNIDNNVWKRVGRSKRPNIPNNAQWFWTNNYNNHNRVYCRLTLDKPVIRRSPKFSTRSYDKIKLFMKQIRNELSRDLKAADLLSSNKKQEQVVLMKRISKTTQHMSNIKRQLRAAQNTYTRYKSSMSKANSNKNAIYASLRRQRALIKVELRYINKMEREAAGLKRHTTQYNLIVKEIRQMRAQVKREIADVEKAYAMARSKTNRVVRSRKSQLSRYSSTVQRLHLLLKRTHAKHNNLKLRLLRAQKLRQVSQIGDKTLIALSNGLHDLQNHIHRALARKTQLNFRNGYRQCHRSKSYILRKYRRMTCTK